MMSALHPDLLNGLFNGSHCERAKNVTWSWFRNLHIYNLLSNPPGSLVDIRKEVHSFSLHVMNFEGQICSKNICPCNRCDDIQSVADGLVDIILKSVQGYCLDCTIKEATGSEELTCRIAHG
jgi:hypothetical protein